MRDPGDAALLGFAAAFVGWRDLTSRGGQWEGIRRGYVMDNWIRVPDYVNDLNAWHRDVWPKIARDGDDLKRYWFIKLGLIVPGTPYSDKANASARERCLALYNALGGKLPEPPA